MNSRIPACPRYSAGQPCPCHYCCSSSVTGSGSSFNASNTQTTSPSIVATREPQQDETNAGSRASLQAILGGAYAGVNRLSSNEEAILAGVVGSSTPLSFRYGTQLDTNAGDTIAFDPTPLAPQPSPSMPQGMNRHHQTFLPRAVDGANSRTTAPKASATSTPDMNNRYRGTPANTADNSTGAPAWPDNASNGSFRSVQHATRRFDAATGSNDLPRSRRRTLDKRQSPAGETYGPSDASRYRQTGHHAETKCRSSDSKDSDSDSDYLARFYATK